MLETPFSVFHFPSSTQSQVHICMYAIAIPAAILIPFGGHQRNTLTLLIGHDFVRQRQQNNPPSKPNNWLSDRLTDWLTDSLTDWLTLWLTVCQWAEMSTQCSWKCASWLRLAIICSKLRRQQSACHIIFYETWLHSLTHNSLLTTHHSLPTAHSLSRWPTLIRRIHMPQEVFSVIGFHDYIARCLNSTMDLHYCMSGLTLQLVNNRK